MTLLEMPSRIDRLSLLTAKEREVLELIAEGWSNGRIAKRLSVTGRTVETHTGRIFAKLGLRSDPATHRRVLAVLALLRSTGSLADDGPLAAYAS
jgi:DNA-binding NarL/FixJ family response regulator